jgi:integrase
MKLTVTAIKNAKPKEKPYKLSDGGGLYLLVKSSGKYWRYDYRFADKRKTFESVANEWYLSMKDHWSESHSERIISYLKRDVYPWLGSMPIESIKAPEIITIIKRVSGRGALDAAKRVKGFIQQVLDYAVAHAKVSRNPARDINL